MVPELVYTFGHFRLIPERRVLLGAGEPLKLGGRAFDVLLALVEHHDSVLSRDSLMQLVWPRLVVEPSNLNVQVLTLRKVLGHPAIATVPGRGYRFALRVGHEGREAAANDAMVGVAASAPAPPTEPKRHTNLPVALPELFGRAEDLVAVERLLAMHRVVTIAGPAGIGKTRLGQAVATRQVRAYPDGVWWIELASVDHESLVVPAIASALGIDPVGQDPTQAVLAQLCDQHRLLMLDNCEHLLEAIAPFAEALWAAAPRVTLLITSQEPLKTAAEHIYRLNTLGLPAEAHAQVPAAVAHSGAGALFRARARAVEGRFDIVPANVAAVHEICRRLDGLPLAIELAAARLPLLGIEGLRRRLDQRFDLLTGGARAVLRRHRTLIAALEWSHSRLTLEETVVFRRLGVFPDGFTLEAAQRVASDDAIDAWDVLEHLGALVDKSLVIAGGDSPPRFKMLETTRLFALERLDETGETDATLRRHVQARMALAKASSKKPAGSRTAPGLCTCAGISGGPAGAG